MLHQRIGHDVAFRYASLVFAEIGGLYPEAQQTAVLEWLTRVLTHAICAYQDEIDKENRRLNPLKPSVN